MSNFYCDVADTRTARDIVATGQCPAEKEDPITGDRLTNPMVFFCDSGEYKPASQRQHIKCYNKSTVKSMYDSRSSAPFVEPTSRGKFTSAALSEIKKQIGVQPERPLYRPLHARTPGEITKEDFFNAVIVNRPAPIKMYVDQGNSVDARDYRGNTALMKAAVNGNLKMVMTLAMMGANINAKNNNGTTPLMAAAASGKANVVEFLLNSGANPYAMTHSGRTAANFAANKKIKSLITGEPVVTHRKRAKRKTQKRKPARRSSKKKSPKRKKSKSPKKKGKRSKTKRRSKSPRKRR